MSWLYDGLPIEEIDDTYCGFVYLITNIQTHKQYIGKKLLQFKKTKIVKGKKKRYKVESDWKTYWSSSDYLKEDVKLYGEHNFKREIIRLCKEKGELSYWEAKYQFEYDVLLYPDKFYNEWISIKTRRSHLLTKRYLTEQQKGNII
jgi:hypothetical protein